MKLLFSVKNNTAMLIPYLNRIQTFLIFALLIIPATINAQDLVPDDLEFRRVAVKRMIFDRSQNIPLSGILPSRTSSGVKPKRGA